jgi:hypothetical protein
MERIWYYYVQKKQMGPVTQAELEVFISQGDIKQTDLVFREGMENWKSLKDVPELAVDVKPPLPLPIRKPEVSKVTPFVEETSEKRISGLRASIKETVVVHNNKKIFSCVLSNISLNGVFLKTEEKGLQLNDSIHIAIKQTQGLGKPMVLKGKVVRVEKDATGYGIELKGVTAEAVQKISEYLRDQVGLLRQKKA